MVLDVEGNGATLINLDDSKIVRRHLDNIKDATATVTADLETCWMDLNQTTPIRPQIPIALAPVPPNVPPQAPTPNNPVMSGLNAPMDAVNGRPHRHRQQPQRYSDEHWEMEK